MQIYLLAYGCMFWYYVMIIASSDFPLCKGPSYLLNFVIECLKNKPDSNKKKIIKEIINE